MEANGDRKVSVITICFNAEKVIEKTMKSVLAQTYTDFEYIIKDGGSTDGTNQIIQRYEEKFRKRGIPFRHIVEKDRGIYDAMNQATDAAAGRWLNYMNADDIFWDDTVLEQIFDNREYSGDILYGDSVCEYEFVKGKKEYTLWKGQHQDFSMMPFCHQACFFRDDLIKEYHYDLSYRSAADFHVLLRAKVEGKRLEPVGQIVSLCTMDGVSNVEIKTSFLETVKIKERLMQEEFLPGNLRFSLFAMGVKQWILKHLPYAFVGRLLRFQVRRKGQKIYQSISEIKEAENISCKP